MSAPTPAVQRLGRQLLERELASDGQIPPDTAGLASAAERATQRLAGPLGRLLGVEGYWGLLRRAVHVAKAEAPLLQDLQLSAAPSGGLGSLHAAVSAADPAQARDALTAVLAHLVWLLISFIGERLTHRILRDAWPDVQFDGEAPISSEEPNT